MVKEEDSEKFQVNTACCTEEILKAKNVYIVRMTTKLSDPKTALTTFWSILNHKKIPPIPFLLANNKFLSEFC